MADDITIDTGLARDDAPGLEGDTVQRDLQTGGSLSDPRGWMLRRGRDPPTNVMSSVVSVWRPIWSRPPPGW